MERILEDMTDDELIAHIRANLMGGHMSYEAARGELLRRATLKVANEVRKFNRCSTLLALAMIGLTVVIGVMTAAQVYLARLAH